MHKKKEAALKILISVSLVGLRTKAGFTQATLALASGISRASIASIESATTLPSVKMVYALSGALNCDVLELLPKSLDDVPMLSPTMTRLTHAQKLKIVFSGDK